MTFSSVSSRVKAGRKLRCLVASGGMKAYGEIAGINMAVLSLIMGFSAPLVGILYDRTGSYELALLGMIAGSVLCALLYLAIGRYRYTTDFRSMPRLL